ncbi:MAG TPA: DinB family protein [Anaerolineales bacterium]
MAHPLVEQFRFTRSEWSRGLRGITPDDATRHFGPMNCISWIVGHLTWQEQRYWLQRSQGIVLYPELNRDFAFGAPMSAPPLKDMLKAWRHVTRAADPFLDSLTTKMLKRELLLNGKVVGQSMGSALRRNTYHYWYHIGEIQAIRQMLGHSKLPSYVGNIEGKAPYRPE